MTYPPFNPNHGGFQGTNEEYEIATRGRTVSGHLSDNGDGFYIVAWGQDEYKVFYQYGFLHHIERFGRSGLGEFWDWLKTE